eukprot:753118-Hanusia_phi.AAC.1
MRRIPSAFAWTPQTRLSPPFKLIVNHHDTSGTWLTIDLSSSVTLCSGPAPPVIICAQTLPSVRQPTKAQRAMKRGYRGQQHFIKDTTSLWTTCLQGQ